MEINYFTGELFKKIYFNYLFTKLQQLLFYWTDLSDAKTDSLAKGRLSDKQAPV